MTGDAATGAFSVSAGKLVLDNSAATGATSLTNTTFAATNGEYQLLGSAAGTSTQTFSGALTPGSGGAVVTVTPGTSQAATLTAASLATQTKQGSILFRGTNLGVNAVGTAGSTNITFGTTPTLTNGVIVGALADTSATGNGSNFATYGTNGVTVLASQATYAGSGQTSSNTALSLATGANTITGAQVNTLKVDNSSGGAAALAINTTTLNADNGLLFTGTSAITTSGTAINFSTDLTNGYLFSTNSAGVAIGNAITGGGNSTNNSIVIGGNGTITLNGAISFNASGTTNTLNIENRGTTVLGAAVSTTNNPTTDVVDGTLQLATGGSFGKLNRALS